MRSQVYSLSTIFAVAALLAAGCSSNSGVPGGAGIDSLTDSFGADDDATGDGDGDGDGATGDGDGDGDGATGDGDGDGATGDGDGGIKFDVGDGIVGGMGGECEQVMIEGEFVPPNIMLVLDASCSMGFNGDEGWNALTTSITSLANKYNANTRMGARFFPFALAGNSDFCPGNAVDVPIADNNAMQVLNMMNSTGPDGGTPLSPASHQGIQALKAESVGDRIMIIVSDGVPNSNDSCSSGTIADEITAARTADMVTTYAVGLGSSLNTGQMDSWAQAGGTGNYIPAANTAQLEMALDGIVSNVISCTVALAPPPDFPDLVEVTVGGVTYTGPLSDASACGDGFYYTSAAQDEIELCGAACDDLKVELSADIVYKCAQG